eukprot:6482433-Amphidinium_carterae.1
MTFLNGRGNICALNTHMLAKALFEKLGSSFQGGSLSAAYRAPPSDSGALSQSVFLPGPQQQDRG